jgi:hypothetical protein
MGFIAWARGSISKDRLLKLTVFAALYYIIVFSLVLKPYGNYENYNSVISALTDGTSINSLVPGLKSFATYGLTGVPLILITLFVLSRSVGQRNIWATTEPLFLGSLLVFTSILPYLLVGKYSVVLEGDWRSRHAILLGIAGPLALALLINSVKFEGKTRIVTKVIIASVVFSNFGLLSIEAAKKYQRSQLDSLFVLKAKEVGLTNSKNALNIFINVDVTAWA